MIIVKVEMRGHSSVGGAAEEGGAEGEGYLLRERDHAPQLSGMQTLHRQRDGEEEEEGVARRGGDITVVAECTIPLDDRALLLTVQQAAMLEGEAHREAAIAAGVPVPGRRGSLRLEVAAASALDARTSKTASGRPSSIIRLKVRGVLFFLKKLCCVLLA